jgi:hypothetical protein
MTVEEAKTMSRFTYGLVAAVLFSTLVVVFSYTRPWGCHSLLTVLSPETLSAADAEEKGKEATLSEFRVQAHYRAIRLTWEARTSEKGQLTFQVYRSMANPDGEYTLVTSINGTPEVNRYEYDDKNIPVEENYFYKIKIPETKEAFGPLQARPPFSRPST